MTHNTVTTGSVLWYLANNTAVALGDEWTATDLDNPDVHGFYLIRETDGLRLHASPGWGGAGKITYMPSWPRPARGDVREFWPRGPVPKINVAETRKPEAHAAEITRRLLPAAEEGLAYVRDKIDAAGRRHAEASTMIREIEALGLTVHRRNREPGGWIPDVPGDVKIEDGGRVRFDWIVLGDEQAIELVKLLHRFYTEGAR